MHWTGHYWERYPAETMPTATPHSCVPAPRRGNAPAAQTRQRWQTSADLVPEPAVRPQLPGTSGQQTVYSRQIRQPLVASWVPCRGRHSFRVWVRNARRPSCRWRSILGVARRWWSPEWAVNHLPAYKVQIATPSVCSWGIRSIAPARNTALLGACSRDPRAIPLPVRLHGQAGCSQKYSAAAWPVVPCPFLPWLLRILCIRENS